MDVANAVKDIKAGGEFVSTNKVTYTHLLAGSFNVDQLAENIRSFVDSVQRLKPSTSKGVCMRQCCISSTMGPGLRVSL